MSQKVSPSILLEVAAVGMVADPHALGLDLLGQFGQQLGRVDHGLRRGQVLAAASHGTMRNWLPSVWLNSMVCLQVVAQQGVEARVRAAALQAVVRRASCGAAAAFRP